MKIKMEACKLLFTLMSLEDNLLTMVGFKNLGWDTKEYIYGNRAPKKWTTKGSAKTVSSSFLKKIATDVIRIFLRYKNRIQAFKELKNSDLVYERFAAFQELGSIFQKNGIPWILETNAPLFYEAKNERNSSVLNLVMKKLEIQAYKKCDILVCVSQTLKEIIISQLGISPDKIHVMPNGVDIDYFNPDSYKQHRLTNDFVIGFVGTTQKWQRLDILFEAIHQLRKEGYPISCIVVGDGNAYDEWHSMINKNGWGKFINFIGRVSRKEVPEYIKGFDICYSAPQEMDIGLYISPLKLYEYMAMSKPVLASNTEDSKKLILNNSTGYLFQFGDIVDLKSKIIEAYNSKKELEEMGRNARSLIVENHSWEKRIEILYNQIKLINQEDNDG